MAGSSQYPIQSWQAAYCEARATVGCQALKSRATHLLQHGGGRGERRLDLLQVSQRRLAHLRQRAVLKSVRATLVATQPLQRLLERVDALQRLVPGRLRVCAVHTDLLPSV